MGEDRLVTFEVGGSVYALPIADVIEVADAEPLACIPTLPSQIGGVINYHGDALPVIHRPSLLDLDEAELPEPKHVLVLGEGPTGGACLGLLVDRVVGLVDGGAAAGRGPGPVAERRSVGGRVLNVLDPEMLVARARQVIEHSLGPSE
jgi:chemotaxis signal transduction protein